MSLLLLLRSFISVGNYPPSLPPPPVKKDAERVKHSPQSTERAGGVWLLRAARFAQVCFSVSKDCLADVTAEEEEEEEDRCAE